MATIVFLGGGALRLAELAQDKESTLRLAQGKVTKGTKVGMALNYRSSGALDNGQPLSGP